MSETRPRRNGKNRPQCVSSFWLLRRVVLLLGQQRLLGPAFCICAERGARENEDLKSASVGFSTLERQGLENETRTYSKFNERKNTRVKNKSEYPSLKIWHVGSQKKSVRLLGLLLLGGLGRLALAEANVAIGERTENRRAEAKDGLARQRVPARCASGRGEAKIGTMNQNQKIQQNIAKNATTRKQIQTYW
jgi:hypothetical protein